MCDASSTDIPSPNEWPQELCVETTGQRLDAFLAERLSDYSRSLLKKAIAAGHVTIDGERQKPSFRLEPGMRVVVAQLEPPPAGPEPEEILLDLLYEDGDMAVVNKPPGMVVHPAKGHWAGTLASALAFHFGKEGLSQSGGANRPGIVHRLDRDTTGVIVVAKHDKAHQRLADQFANRTVKKEYLALVLGVPDRDADVIDQPIGPHPKVREKMAIRPGHPQSRDALTHYEVVERFKRFSLVRCKPKTGRTHQVRIHLAHLGYAVMCDKQYGGRTQITARELRGELPTPDEMPVLERQALHAHRLMLDQPTTGERLRFEAPLPEDMDAVLRLLRG